MPANRHSAPEREQQEAAATHGPRRPTKLSERYKPRGKYQTCVRMKQHPRLRGQPTRRRKYGSIYDACSSPHLITSTTTLLAASDPTEVPGQLHEWVRDENGSWVACRLPTSQRRQRMAYRRDPLGGNPFDPPARPCPRPPLSPPAVPAPQLMRCSVAPPSDARRGRLRR